MASTVGATAFDAFLTQQETEELMQILCEEPDGWTFETLSRNFNSIFSNKSDHYRIGKALEMFLLCGILDKPTAQLVAVYLLYDMYREAPLAQNVFAPVFFSILHPEMNENIYETLFDRKEEDAESAALRDHLSRTRFLDDVAEWFLMGLAKFPPGARWFVAKLAAGPSAELFSKSPSFFTRMDPNNLSPVNFAQFDQEFLSRYNQVPIVDRSGVSCIIDHPDVTVVGARHEGIKAAKETAEALVSGQKPQSDLAFLPDLMRPVPPVMPLGNGELVWMNPRVVEELKLFLDPTILVYPPKWLAASQLIVKAARSPLHVDEQSALISTFEQDPAFVLGGAIMTTEDILGIVENNPSVATEILKRVHKMPEKRFKKYLNAFLETNISVHTMEVINRLHEAQIVPTDFLPLYVSYALRKCDSASLGDSSYNQTRLVRLVCVFIQSAVRNKSLNLVENPDLLVEIQAFCVKQTNVKEALTLYRFLKSNQSLDGSMDSFDNSSSEGTSPSKGSADRK